MRKITFDRAKHVYKNDAFAELVKDAVRFFNGTPVQTLPPSASFFGVGIYSIYYTGRNPLYTRYAELNRLDYRFPIYVGKAVPRGWRRSRTAHTTENQSKELYGRLSEHARSIGFGNGLSIDEFSCRFVIFEDAGSDMISTVEAALIKLNRPLWNSVVDGFGNHDPGSGRYEQAKSDWDVLHPGRRWAVKCNGRHRSRLSIISMVQTHLSNLQ